MEHFRRVLYYFTNIYFALYELWEKSHIFLLSKTWKISWYIIVSVCAFRSRIPKSWLHSDFELQLYRQLSLHFHLRRYMGVFYFTHAVNINISKLGLQTAFGRCFFLLLHTSDTSTCHCTCSKCTLTLARCKNNSSKSTQG